MAATQDVTVDPTVGDVFEASRSDELYQVIYIDEQITLLRCNVPGQNHQGGHRMEKRTDFDASIRAGQFTLQPDSELDMLSNVEVDWSEVGYIGEQTTENLHDAGYRTVLDIQQASDDDLLDVGGLGTAGLSNLREYAV